MSELATRPNSHSTILVRWMTKYRVLSALLFVSASTYLADWEPDYAGWSFPLICAGESLRVWAAGNLRKGTVNTGGPYGVIRNPMYVGSILIAIGLCAIGGSIWIWFLALIYFTVFYLPTVKYEEATLRKKFPFEFAAYSSQVPAFHPTLRRYTDTGPGFSRKLILQNKEHFMILGILLVYAYLILIFGNVDWMKLMNTIEGQSFL